MGLEWGTRTDMIELGDEGLALRGTQGDRRAFEAIYRRYHQDLYRFCLAMLGDPHDAQDALQNAMVKVLRALPGEKREIKLRPWLYRIARNEAIETLRRRREYVVPEPEQVAPSGAQIAERAEDRERLRRLFADLEQLPERQRGALVMRELGGLSFEEIATAFETTPATARQTVYEARLSLRQMDEGREMRCELATRALSEADGRSLRRRDLRAHLRGCASCRTFAAEIEQRRTDLAALAPLPLAVSSGILHGLVAGGAGKALAGSAIAKSASAVAVAALVGVSVAGRVGLIDVPLASRDSVQGAKAAPSATAPRSAAPDSPAAALDHVHGGAHVAPAARSRAVGEGTATRAARHASAISAAGGEQPANGAPSASPAARSPARRGRDEGVGGKGGAAPKGPPEAAGHGQQVATSHKPPEANPSPGSTGHGGAPPPRAGAGGQPSPPARAPASPPKAEPVQPAPETPGGQPEQPQDLEQPASGDHGPDGPGPGPLQH